LTIANSLGNGVADDKAIYAFVPAMIEYYLGEKPALAQVPTWICAERAQRDHVLDHLDALVTKPIDGLGGSGVVIAPEASVELLDHRRRELQAQPERYIAQDVIALSTHPTFDGEGMYPHHVDLRAFVHLRAGPGDSVSAHVMPAALTRVAALGSRIVNSSSGGGSKDTWIRTDKQDDPGSM
jgi:carboxylate-amine ligase